MVNEYMIEIGCRLMIWLKLINNIIHRIKNRDNFRPKTEDRRQSHKIPSWEGMGVGFLKTEDRRQKTEVK